MPSIIDLNNFNKTSQLRTVERIIVFISWIGMFLCIPPLVILGIFKSINTYDRAVVFRLGRLTSRKVRGPGLITINPMVDEVVTVVGCPPLKL